MYGDIKTAKDRLKKSSTSGPMKQVLNKMVSSEKHGEMKKTLADKKASLAKKMMK